MVEKPKELSIIRGFTVTEEGLVVTHLQFADATLFFRDASREEVMGYKAVLRCFELASGLRINLGTALIGVDMDQDTLNNLLEEVACGVEDFPLNTWDCQ